MRQYKCYSINTPAHLYYFCWRKTVGSNIFRLTNSKNCWPVRTVAETFDSFVEATFLTFVGPTVLGPYYLKHQQISSVERQNL